jgi:hypothetical protein
LSDIPAASDIMASAPQPTGARQRSSKTERHIT